METVNLTGWPAERTLTVIGPADRLQIPFVLQWRSGEAPPSAEPLRVELTGPTGEPVPVQLTGGLPVVTSGATAPGRLRLRLDAATPPGRYEGRLIAAGVERPLRIDIVETIDFTLRPAPLIIDTSLGTVQRVALSIANSGNVTLTMDLSGSYPLGQEMPLLAGDDAPEAGRGIGRLLALLPSAQRRIPLLREIGTITIVMPEGPARIEPGAGATIPIDVTLPGDLAATVRYRAYVPFYDEDLAILIVTAAKSMAPAPGQRTSK